MKKNEESVVVVSEAMTNANMLTEKETATTPAIAVVQRTEGDNFFNSSLSHVIQVFPGCSVTLSFIYIYIYIYIYISRVVLMRSVLLLFLRAPAYVFVYLYRVGLLLSRRR